MMIMTFIVAILVMILAWTAYHRSISVGVDQEISNADNQVHETIKEVNSEVNPLTAEERQQMEKAWAEARGRLTELKEIIAAGEFSEAVNQVPEIRNDLKDAYIETKGDIKQRWQDLDTDLALLESQVHKKSNQSLATLEKVLQQM